MKSSSFKPLRKTLDFTSIIWIHKKMEGEKAKDFLLMSIRVAIAGNIIDFGAKNAHIDIEKEVEQILERINLSFFYLKQNVL